MCVFAYLQARWAAEASMLCKLLYNWVDPTHMAALLSHFSTASSCTSKLPLSVPHYWHSYRADLKWYLMWAVCACHCKLLCVYFGAGGTHLSKEPFSCVDLIPELLLQRSTGLMLFSCVHVCIVCIWVCLWVSAHMCEQVWSKAFLHTHTLSPCTCEDAINTELCSSYNKYQPSHVLMSFVAAIS